VRDDKIKKPSEKEPSFLQMLVDKVKSRDNVNYITESNPKQPKQRFNSGN